MIKNLNNANKPVNFKVIVPLLQLFLDEVPDYITSTVCKY